MRLNMPIIGGGVAGCRAAIDGAERRESACLDSYKRKGDSLI